MLLRSPREKDTEMRTEPHLGRTLWKQVWLDGAERRQQRSQRGRWGRNMSAQRSGYHERRPWEVGAGDAEGEN